MQSLWNEAEAGELAADDLSARVYTSRLLGRDKALVLYGGGNTSVKSVQTDVFGDPEEILWVKGSGGDLAGIDRRGFSPLRLAPTRRLAQLTDLTDEQMVRHFRMYLTDPAAPLPSVEAIVHAILPHKWVDHTHADAVVTIVNTPDGAERVRGIWGDRMVLIPYVMPGFKLARSIAEIYPREATDRTIGLILLNHGIFTFGSTARESYERMIEAVSEAEAYLARHARVPPKTGRASGAAPLAVAQIRRAVSDVAGRPMIVSVGDDPAAEAFARRGDVTSISQRGPATPDHVIRTKPAPLIGRDVHAFAGAYRAYFNEFAAGKPLTMLDPAPRVILDPELGLLTAGKTATDAAIAAEIYRRTIPMILSAEAMGGWRPVSRADLFDVEYWDLEQAKLRRGGTPPVFTGEVALVTGAASGIGRACVDSLLARGAAVVGLDLNESVASMLPRKDFLGVRCDVTDEGQLRDGVASAARAFGGIDMLILNAGIFPKSCMIKDLPLETWRRVMSVNLDANLVMLREAHPMLKLAPRGGRVVVIGSKNVPAPGAGASAYSASKAAMNQLARVAALEWGGDGIRINSIHPNMVFDTGLWTKEVLESRAQAYGLTVEQYKTNNVLKTEVTSRDVAELAAEMCGPLFAKTTGAQVPVDGGNDRVI